MNTNSSTSNSNNNSNENTDVGSKEQITTETYYIPSNDVIQTMNYHLITPMAVLIYPKTDWLCYDDLMYQLRMRSGGMSRRHKIITPYFLRRHKYVMLSNDN